MTTDLLKEPLRWALTGKRLICDDCGKIKCEFCWNVKRAAARIYFFQEEKILLALEDQDYISFVRRQISSDRPALSWEQTDLLEQVMIRYGDYGDKLARWGKKMLNENIKEIKDATASLKLIFTEIVRAREALKLAKNKMD